MRKKSWVVLGIVTCIILAGCSINATDHNSGEYEEVQEILENEETVESGEVEDILNQQVEEEPARLNLASFDSMPDAAKQMGFSFRALKDFNCVDYHFTKFKMVQDVDSVQDMEVAAPNNMIVVRYEDATHMRSIEVSIFPYEGEILQSVASAPICYVSTESVNGIDVDLSEYILRMVPVDYEMTEEDKALDPGKIGFSADGVTTKVTDLIFRKMYWVQDNVYYEVAVGEADVPVETMKNIVEEFMAAELFGE